MDRNFRKCLCDLLSPFNDLTEIISGSTYPTINIYYALASKIKETIELFNKQEKYKQNYENKIRRAS